MEYAYSHFNLAVLYNSFYIKTVISFPSFTSMWMWRPFCSSFLQHQEKYRPDVTLQNTRYASLGTMNFRQRMAWLCLAFYLASSVAVVYYFLDIADQYAVFSLEHSKLHDSSDSDVPFWQFWQHIGDIPFPVLVLLLAIPYFQIFAALFYCTLPTVNKNVNKCLIPVIGCIYLFQKVFSVFRSHEDTELDSRLGHHHIVSVSWLLFSIMTSI